MAANAVPKVAPNLVGTFRRLGEFGPAYEILAVEHENVSVEVPETGERLTLALEDVLADPSAK